MPLTLDSFAVRPQQLPQFVVVSTGRAGSVWLSEVLCRAGIPTTHEQHYTAKQYAKTGGKPSAWNRGDGIGEVTAQIVPFLDDVQAGRVWHQVRHPLPCIGSLVGFGLFHPTNEHGAAGELIRRYCDLEGDQKRNAAKFWCDWNERCEQHADRRWQVEQVDVDLIHSLGEDVGIDIDRQTAAEAIAAVPATRNTRKNAVNVAWGDLGDQHDRVRQLATRYGYLED
jgi:hypothetical protein